MARPKKSKEERYVVKNIRFPPAIWAELVEAIPAGQRSAFIQQQVERALRQIRGHNARGGVPGVTLASTGEERDLGDDLPTRVFTPASGSSRDSPAAEPDESERAGEPSLWEKIDELIQQVPDEEFARLPVDGSEQHDHYIYGLPKRQR